MLSLSIIAVWRMKVSLELTWGFLWRKLIEINESFIPIRDYFFLHFVYSPFWHLVHIHISVLACFCVYRPSIPFLSLIIPCYNCSMVFEFLNTLTHFIDIDWILIFYGLSWFCWESRGIFIKAMSMSIITRSQIKIIVSLLIFCGLSLVWFR